MTSFAITNGVARTALSLVLLAACEDTRDTDAGMDRDAGMSDAGTPDAGSPDDGIVRCTGRITQRSTECVADPFGGEVGIGDTVQLEFTFDPTEIDVNAAPQCSEYRFDALPTGLTARFESWTISNDPNFVDCFVFMANDDDGVCDAVPPLGEALHDQFEMDCYMQNSAPQIDSLSDSSSWIILQDSTEAWLSSTALPPLEGNWGPFTFSEFGIEGVAGAGCWRFLGQVESCE
jgi:hypothetical protein